MKISNNINEGRTLSGQVIYTRFNAKIDDKKELTSWTSFFVCVCRERGKERERKKKKEKWYNKHFKFEIDDIVDINN